MAVGDIPNLVATLTLETRTQAGSNLDGQENRGSEYGALDLIRKQTASPESILSSDAVRAIANSFGNTVKVPVFDREVITLGTSRTCAVQTGGPVSKLVTLTPATITFGFALAPSQHFNNDVAYQAAYTRALTNRLKALALKLDTDVRNLLETNKNTVLSGLTAYYANTGGALRVPLASKDDLFNNLASIMATLDFGMNADVLTNPMGMADVRKWGAAGANNAQNLMYQLGGYDFRQSNRVTNGTGVRETFYAIAPGSIAMATRLDPDALAQNRIHESKGWAIARNLPYVNMDMGVFYQADCADASALQSAGMNGLTATMVESWQFSVDVVYVTAYNSDSATKAGGIQKIEVLTT